MNRKILNGALLLAFLILFLGASSFAGRTIDKIKFPPLNNFEMPEVDKVTLDNGIILYLLEDHELPIVRANLRLAAGGYLEPADKIGLAGIAGQVMRTGGTAKMTGDEIDEVLEALGASVEVNIGNTSGGASMNILSEYVDTGLEILADVLRTPQFDQDKIDLAKTSERTSISSRNDDQFGICIREFRKILYGSESPYARHTEYASIESITRDDLIAFHGQFITPENIMIAIWGDFNKDSMIEKIKKYFGDWPTGSGKVPMVPEVNYDYKPSVNYIEKENVTQSAILLGHIGGLMGDPDYFALTVANNVLGGSLGGRMFKEVRSKKGLAYSTSGVYTSNISYPGIFYNYVITKLESTAEATKAVKHEVERMQTDPPTPDELKKAKDAYLNSFVFKFDSKGEIINRMMSYDYYDFPRDFLQTAKEKIEMVTAEDVVDVAKRRFHPNKMHLVVVGIAEQFDEPLTTFGSVEDIDITIPSGESEEEIVVNEETLAKGAELLKKAVDACGGIDNYKKIKSTSSNSSITLVLPQGEIAMEVSSVNILPSHSKEIMNTPMGEIVSCNNGDTGWMIQGGQVVDLTPEQLADSKKDEFRNTILVFQKSDNPDYKAVYVETTEIGGAQADIVKIISPDGDNSFKLAIDVATGMPVTKMYFGNTIMGPGNITQVLSDFRDVSGVKIPFATTIESDGNKVVGVAVNSYEINPSIPEDAFNKPE